MSEKQSAKCLCRVCNISAANCQEIKLSREKRHQPPREGEYGAMNKLIAAYDEYIALLGAELDELSGFAATHGWKSTRYEAGRLCRRKIESAKITAKIAEGK